MPTGVGASVLAVPWATECCDISPIRLADGHFVCRGCGLKWFDTARDVRRIFGPGVVNSIALEAHERRPMTQDEWMIERWME